MPGVIHRAFVVLGPEASAEQVVSRAHELTAADGKAFSARIKACGPSKGDASLLLRQLIALSSHPLFIVNPWYRELLRTDIPDQIAGKGIVAIANSQVSRRSHSSAYGVMGFALDVVERGGTLPPRRPHDAALVINDDGDVLVATLVA